MVNKLNRNYLLIAYKLLHDILALMLTSFAVIILLNGMLPEFFLGSAIFLKLILALTALVAAIAYLGKKLGLEFPLQSAQKNLTIPFLLVFAFLVTGNALLKLRFWENIVITFLMLVSLYQLYRIQTAAKR